MINIRKIKTLTLSEYINIIRQFLFKNGFFEHTLYNAVPYKIENADIFRLRDDLFLRYGTEPDVWEAGECFDKFFFIGSLFRDEKILTKIHNYEFKILDFYIKNGSIEDVINIFLKLLEEIEKTSQGDKLSKLNIKYISWSDFQKNNFESDRNYWLVVLHYPIEESFYDTPFRDVTNKFEIMFVTPQQVIEIASAGFVGRNINKKMRIKNDKDLANKRVLEKKFIGFGFGIERLIYLYESYGKV